jgi:Zn-dependent peptidase ImmA (M78 family)/transcriptional regulator with XRE-family HTH domain
MERRSGINSGYLSQLERNEIAQPTPSVLGRLSEPYGEPFEVLMEWAGYITQAPEGISPNRKRALNFIPDDINDQELKALRAVVEALRGSDSSANSLRKRHRYDLALHGDERQIVKATARALLREMDAQRSSEPVDLDEAMKVAKLVGAGAIELDLRQKRRLRDRFGDLVDWALSNLQGMVNLDSGEVFVKSGLHEKRRRFVLAHEIGHAALEDHRLVFAHLDDDKRLDPEFEDRLESQANHFSIELLSKGDLLRQEFDGSRPSIDNLKRVTTRFAISRQAGARRVAEETKQDCAIAIAWRADHGNGPLYLNSCKVLTSASFEDRFRWHATGLPAEEIKNALKAIAVAGAAEPFVCTDSTEKNSVISIDGLDAHFAVIAMLVPEPTGIRIASLKSFASARR